MKALLLTTAISIAIGAVRAGGEEESARDLVKRVIDTVPNDTYVARMKLTTPGGLVREYTTSGKPLEKDLDARYLEVTDPFSLHDTRYLFYERTEKPDEQFTYVPALKRVIRLSEKTRREPFLGSTFYVTDMVAPALDDFTYQFVGEETVGGRKTRLVESVPKIPDREFYGKSILAIDPTDLVVLRAQLYDQKGNLFKVLTVETIEKIKGHWTPMHQRMENVQDHTTSQLQTVEINYGVPLSDEMFHIAYLGR
ncbi:MAG: outer membrane lipoprotein-sorting protein [Candidatus Binatia bacterium]